MKPQKDFVGNKNNNYCLTQHETHNSTNQPLVGLIVFFVLTYIYYMKWIQILICLCITQSIFAQENVYSNQANYPYIRTVELRRLDLALAPPAIDLNTQDQLRLSFDDLSGYAKSYYYTFTHCNQNWEPSELNHFEYLDGFEENFLNDYAFSFGTSTKYVHYSVDFPNSDVSFRISGNYVIQIWDQNNDSIPVLTRRFYVFENLTPISANITTSNVVAYRKEYQKLEFTVDLKNLPLNNPYELIKVSAIQNNLTQRGMYDLKPRLIQNNLMIYDDNDMVFPALKEYRRFDTRTLKFQTDRIVKIERRPEITNVFINIDENRGYKQYFYEKDMNGNYVILADLTQDPELEGDYAMIYFTLEYPYWLNNGNFYVVGAFNDYNLSEENKMQYDFDRQQYTSKIFLKQGYYNYMYVFVPNGTQEYDFTYAEGNNFETENEYMILVYSHSYERDHDTIIGYKIFNSRQ